MLDESAFAEPRLRVLAVTPTLAPGGAEQQLVTLVRNCQRVSFTAIVGLGGVGGHDGYRLGKLVNVPIWVADIHTGDSRESAIERCVKQRQEAGMKFDIILHWGFDKLDLSFTGVPVIHASHASAEEEINTWHMQYYKSMGVSKSNFLTTVCESGVRIFDESQRSKEQVYVIHNGGDIERTRPIMGGAWQRERWKIAADKKVLLFLGRMFNGKGAEVAIDCLSHLPEEYVLVMYGWGDLREELVRRARSTAKGRVMFPQPRFAGLGDVYAAADAVLLPSRSEAFPLVMVEAWQSQTPLVCSEFKTLLECEQKYNNGNPLAWHTPCPPSARELADTVLSIDPADSRVVDACQVGLTELSASAMVGRWESFFYFCMREWLNRAELGVTEWI